MSNSSAKVNMGGMPRCQNLHAVQRKGDRRSTGATGGSGRCWASASTDKLDCMGRILWAVVLVNHVRALNDAVKGTPKCCEV